MTDLLLLCILSGLKPDVEKQLENQLFSLVGVLLRVVFVVLVVALCVGLAIVYPGPAVGLVIILAPSRSLRCCSRNTSTVLGRAALNPLNPPQTKIWSWRLTATPCCSTDSCAKLIAAPAADIA